MLALAFACSKKDNPVKPDPTPQPEEHLFYISPWTGNFVKVFSVEQEAFVDSFTIDSVAVTDTMRIHVIGDDSLLAVSAGMKTFIYDLDQRIIVNSYDAENPIFSRDSRYMQYYNSNISMQELHTFPENVLLYNETNGFFPKFDNDSKYFSLPDLISSRSRLVIYDIHGDSSFVGFNDSLTSNIMIWMNYPSSRHNKLYFGGTGAYGYFIGVINIDSDSVRILKTYEESVPIPVISPDEKYLYFTENLLTFFGGVSKELIYVYDAETEDSVGVIEYEGMEQVGGMIISADSKYMLVKPHNEYNNETNISIIDAKTFQVLGVYDFGYLPLTVSIKYGAKNGII